MSNRFLSVRHPRLLGPSLLAAAASALLLAGCGGAGNTSAARIRTVDAATGAATSNVLVNGVSAYGDQTNFSISPYLYIATGSSTFSGLYVPTASSTAFTGKVNTLSLASGQFYTAYFVGRSDTAKVTDTQYLQVYVTQDAKPSLASGQAAVRVIDAAPDAGTVDVLVNGSAPSPAFTALSFVRATDSFFQAPYVPVSAGTLSIRVNTTGTSTAVISATNVSVAAGQGLTIVIDETTATPAPVYTIHTTNE